MWPACPCNTTSVAGQKPLAELEKTRQGYKQTCYSFPRERFTLKTKHDSSRPAQSSALLGTKETKPNHKNNLQSYKKKVQERI